MVELSVVVPVFNSAGSLHLLVEAINDALKSLRVTYEIILVDDCSTDKSWEALLLAKSKYDHLKILRLKKNTGQINATLAGISNSQGTYIVTIDDDLQYHPRDIALLYREISTHDYEMVCGASEAKKHAAVYSILVKVASALLHYLILPGFRHVNYFSSFKIYRRSVFFKKNGEPFLFHLHFIWKHDPRRCYYVLVKHYERKQGKSSYGWLSLTAHYSSALLFCFSRVSLYAGALFFSALIIITILHFKHGDLRYWQLCTAAIFLFCLLLNLAFSTALRNSSQTKFEIEHIA